MFSLLFRFCPRRIAGAPAITPAPSQRPPDEFTPRQLTQTIPVSFLHRCAPSPRDSSAERDHVRAFSWIRCLLANGEGVAPASSDAGGASRSTNRALHEDGRSLDLLGLGTRRCQLKSRRLFNMCRAVQLSFQGRRGLRGSPGDLAGPFQHGIDLHAALAQLARNPLQFRKVTGSDRDDDVLRRGRRLGRAPRPLRGLACRGPLCGSHSFGRARRPLARPGCRLRSFRRSFSGRRSLG